MKEQFTNEEYGILIAKEIFRDLEKNGYLPITTKNKIIKDKWCKEHKQTDVKYND